MSGRLFFAATLSASLALLNDRAAGQGLQVRPGLWEVSISGMGERTQSICLTPEMVRDLRNLSRRSDPASDCRPSKERVSGNSHSFEVSCTRPVRYNARIRITVSGTDRFVMSQDFTTEIEGRARSGSMTMSYHRIGDCR
ncbi:MAG TPA: DUF3617 family protein [Burkholderiales bacterium]|jgi:hypothetical protein|nr:DUF3617 family protein [Burkholderiales bacterium]